MKSLKKHLLIRIFLETTISHLPNEQYIYHNSSIAIKVLNSRYM